MEELPAAGSSSDSSSTSYPNSEDKTDATVPNEPHVNVVAKYQQQERTAVYKVKLKFGVIVELWFASVYSLLLCSR